MIRYYIGRFIEIYYSVTWGGASRFITILQWGGYLGTPNLYYVIYGRPLKGLYAFIYGKKWIWSGVTDLLQTDSQLKIELLSS